MIVIKHIKKNHDRGVTYIENLSTLFSEKQIVFIIKDLKKLLMCNGTLQDNIMKLQGDRCQYVRDYLTRECGCNEQQICIDEKVYYQLKF